jgi:hypothetical protein
MRIIVLKQRSLLKFHWPRAVVRQWRQVNLTMPSALNLNLF